jgi:hypothetical protein
MLYARTRTRRARACPIRMAGYAFILRSDSNSANVTPEYYSFFPFPFPPLSLSLSLSLSLPLPLTFFYLFRQRGRRTIDIARRAAANSRHVAAN